MPFIRSLYAGLHMDAKDPGINPGKYIANIYQMQLLSRPRCLPGCRQAGTLKPYALHITYQLKDPCWTTIPLDSQSVVQ